ncbi:MAG: DUF2079 domain-containing protein [candidate division WOR-3 bacterium]
MKSRLATIGNWLGDSLVVLSGLWIVSVLILRVSQGPTGFVFGIKFSLMDIPGTVLLATGMGLLGLSISRWRKHMGRLAAAIGRTWWFPVGFWIALSLSWWLVTMNNIRTMAIWGLDTAIFENIFYRISRGDPYLEFMGIHHPYFIFYPMGLLYRFTGLAGPILLHKVLMFSSVPCAWLLARELGHDEEGTGLVTLLIALMPTLWWMGGDAPYPDVCFLSLGILMAWAGLRENYALAAALGLGMLLNSESGGLVLACTGAALAIMTKRWAWLWLVPVGLASVPIALWFQDKVAPERAENRLLYRYGIDSITPASLLGVGLRVFWPSRLYALIRLFLQAGHLPFLGLPISALAIIPAAPQLAVIAPGTNQAKLGLYHGFYSLPLIAIGAIWALRWFRNPVIHGLIAISVSLLSGMRLYRFSPPEGFVKRCEEVASLVPKGDSVAASPYISLKLSRRPYLRIVNNSDELMEELGRTRPWVALEARGFRDMNEADSLLLPRGYERVFADTSFVVWKPPK